MVRDKGGRLIRDLTAADFEVFEDGKRQNIVAFDVINNEGGAAGPGGIRAGAAQPAAPGAATPAAARPAAAAAPGQGDPAVIAFVFDRLSSEARARADKAARIYLEKGHVPGDVVGVFVVDQALHTLLPFSTDVSKVEDALGRAAMQAQTAFASSREEARSDVDRAMKIEEQINSLGEGVAGASGAGQASAQAAVLGSEMVFANMRARMTKAFDRLERDQQGFSSTNGLLAVVSGLKALPGRKTIVFFSEGLTISGNVQAQFESVSAVANRANVSVYAIDAGGLRVASGAQEAREELAQTANQRLRSLARPTEGGGPLMMGLERSEDMLRLNPHTKLGELAENTGGFLVADTNDPTDSFRRITEEMRFYYLVSYTPGNAQFDGTFRSISVKLKRGGLKVYSRKGYLALPPVPRMAEVMPVRSYEGPALALLERNAGANDFPLFSKALSFPEPQRRGRVPILVGLPVADLTFTQDAKSQVYRGDFSVMVRIRDQQGLEVDRMSQHYPVTIPADKVAAAKQGDVLFFKEADLAPGRYTLDAVAYDAQGKRGSVRTSQIDVPQVKEGALALSSLTILKRVEKLSAQEENGDNPLYLSGSFMYPNLGEPLRKSVNPQLGFYFTVYSAGAQSAPTRANVEIVKEGQVLAKTAVVLSAPDSVGRIQHAAALPLERLAPGSYTLKVGVSSGLDSASQQAPFVVEP